MTLTIFDEIAETVIAEHPKLRDAMDRYHCPITTLVLRDALFIPNTKCQKLVRYNASATESTSIFQDCAIEAHKLREEQNRQFKQHAKDNKSAVLTTFENPMDRSTFVEKQIMKNSFHALETVSAVLDVLEAWPEFLPAENVVPEPTTDGHDAETADHAS